MDVSKFSVVLEHSFSLLSNFPVPSYTAKPEKVFQFFYPFSKSPVFTHWSSIIMQSCAVGLCDKSSVKSSLPVAHWQFSKGGRK